MHSDAMRLMEQLGYSICLFYGQGFHPYSIQRARCLSTMAVIVIFIHIQKPIFLQNVRNQ